MDQLFQIRSKLLEASAQLITEKLRIENMIEGTLKSLSEVKASQEKINKKINEILVTKQMDKLIETQFMEVKEQTAKIQNEMESITASRLLKDIIIPTKSSNYKYYTIKCRKLVKKYKIIETVLFCPRQWRYKRPWHPNEQRS
jgi:DNA repair exonuclease SbcCD ATPase subunit